LLTTVVPLPPIVARLLTTITPLWSAVAPLLTAIGLAPVVGAATVALDVRVTRFRKDIVRRGTRGGWLGIRGRRRRGDGRWRRRIALRLRLWLGGLCRRLLRLSLLRLLLLRLLGLLLRLSGGLADSGGDLRHRRLRGAVDRRGRLWRVALLQPRHLTALMLWLLRAHDVAEQKAAAEAGANRHDHGSYSGKKGGSYAHDLSP
jgi:hypothetical protein